MAFDRISIDDFSSSSGFFPPDTKDLFRDPFKAEDSDLIFDFSSSCNVGEIGIQSPDHEDKRRVLLHIMGRLSEQEIVGKGYLADYLRQQYRLNYKPCSLSSTFGGVRLFLSFLGDIGIGVLEEIRRGDLEAYIEHEQDRGLKISTVRTRMAQMYAFLWFLSERGVVRSDLVERKIRLRLPEFLPRAMDPLDVDRLLCVKGSVRDRAMVLMLLRTGMRIGELLKLKVRDVDLLRRKVLIYEGEKNRLGRAVYFSDDAKEALKLWLKERDRLRVFLFYTGEHHGMSYSTAVRVFNRYLDRAGLCHKGYTLHCLRHTYATELLNAGMRLECLQKLMGHTSIEVTRRYARLTDKSREAEYFRAMSIIEKGQRDGHYGFDRELPEVFEAQELLAPHGEELHEPS